MPIPSQYQRATNDFYAFLVDVRDAAGFGSTHQAYTMVQGVLLAFRRRLSLSEAVRFAGVLPPVLRAIFTADWEPDEPRRPFGDRASMTEEVKSLRAGHNFSTDDALALVAGALRRHVDEAAFDRALARLPAGAIDFWRSDGEPT